MKLKELLAILPNHLDISVEHDESKTSSLVIGLIGFSSLVDREVISAEPIFFNKIGVQSINVKVK